MFLITIPNPPFALGVPTHVAHDATQTALTPPELDYEHGVPFADATGEENPTSSRKRPTHRR